jgi:pimeloyl-ACP methyl ester carboxylesterase
MMRKQEAGDRQRLLHPARTEVDSRGKVPDRSVGVLRNEADFRARHWGEVAVTSYGDFLIWLEENLNSQRGEGIGSARQRLASGLTAVSDGRAWGAAQAFEPLTKEQSAAAARWTHPVYACGYNWLDDNDKAATLLAARIDNIINAYNNQHSRCTQVIVVTHSMGGLVARRCAQLPGMAQKIAGVVHGVMPAVGAPVAYRRCKVGMADEAFGPGVVIGYTGQHITAVFAQAPGALQLLPTERYPGSWFKVRDVHGADLPMADMANTSRPYDTVYAERTRWWGLVKEEWLSPEDGKPIAWNDYREALKLASGFHRGLDAHYHPETYAFYGTGVKSFEHVCWRMAVGSAQRLGVSQAPPAAAEVLAMDRNTVRMDGSNPEHVPGPDVTRRQQGIRTVSVPTQHYDLWLDVAADDGDGTVPVASGRAPFPHVRQLFALKGVEHEPAYKDETARQVTAYAITRIAASAAQSIGAGTNTRPGAAQ